MFSGEGVGIGKRAAAGLLLACLFSPVAKTQEAASGKKAQPKENDHGMKVESAGQRPKLVVMLVVDQMRADYVDKFQEHWTGGLRRLVKEGAWFREAAYPYAATETCVGHATISTGSLPTAHGMVSNEWWDRETGRSVTCTFDPNAHNIAYGGAAVRGGDSPLRLLMPSFAEELKYQGIAGTRVVTFSLKARASITMAGHQGDVVTWFDEPTGSWVTSTAYPVVPFVEEYAKAHPVALDYGKSWAPLLPESNYRYDKKAVGAVPPIGVSDSFPHTLRGKAGSTAADASFYSEWEASPFSQTYLAELGALAVDKLGLGKGPSTDYLGISFSSLDYVAHDFGPRSWEVQDELARLDRDLGNFFAHLDRAVGRGNYVVALSADHGGAPVPEDMEKTGVSAGWVSLSTVKERIEKALEEQNYSRPTVAYIGGPDVYLTPGTYEKLKADPKAMQTVFNAILSVPGVQSIYRAEELEDRPATDSLLRRFEAASFFKGRSGDFLMVPKPFWSWDFSKAGASRNYGSMHGSPYYYDQGVPLLLMGYGVRPGEYFGAVTPADIAPTLATLCGITLSAHDGRALGEALQK